MYSRCIYICPFYEHREKLSMRCEGGELRFHDGKATSDYVARYCAAEQWQKCSVAGMLLRYYDRIEDEDQRMRENSYKKRVDVFRYFRKSGDFGRDSSVQLNGDMEKTPAPILARAYNHQGEMAGREGGSRTDVSKFIMLQPSNSVKSEEIANRISGKRASQEKPIAV